MRTDYDKMNYELDKTRLETMGDKFMLAAQWSTNKDQMKDTRKKTENSRDDHNKTKFDLERKVKESQRNRLDLENEVRNLANVLDKTSDENFSNKMYLDKGEAREVKNRERHQQE